MNALGADDPRVVGGYRPLGLLGHGGMGRVYLARPADGGDVVALKVVNRELAAQELFRSRFRREVRAARTVGGHRTARVLDADTEADTPWVATAYVPGLALSEVVTAYGALPAPSVWVLADELLRALREIHAAGLVHRDLKPSNVLLTPQGPRVIDFGIARHVAEPGTPLTRTGFAVGSPGYMAPEQVLGQKAGPAGDVFCLGAVLAYAANGTGPFGEPEIGPHAQMYRIVEQDPELGELPEQAPELTELIRDCLRKPAGERPTLDALLDRTRTAATAAEGGDGPAADWLPADLLDLLARRAHSVTEEIEAAAREGTVLLRAPADAATPGTPDAAPAPAPPVGSDAATAPDADRAPRSRRARRLLVVGVVVVTVVVTGLGAWMLLPWLRDGGDGRDTGAATNSPPTAPGSPADEEPGSPTPSGDRSKSASPTPSDSGEDDSAGQDPARDSERSSDPSDGTGQGDGKGGDDTGTTRGADPPPASGKQYPAAFAGTWASGRDTVVVPSAPDNGKTVTVTYYDAEGWCRYTHSITGTTSTRLFLDAQELVAFSSDDHQCASEATDEWYVTRVDDNRVRYGSSANSYVFNRS